MGFELLLLCALIFIFIVSFCGLLQKIKQSYDRERMIADALFLCVLLIAFIVTFCGLVHRTVNHSCRRHERLSRRQAERNSGDSFSDVYVNSAFQSDRNNESGIFPAAPPPYSQNYADAPPKYEDVIKIEDVDVPATVEVTRNETTTATNMPRVHSSAPPYTIST